MRDWVQHELVDSGRLPLFLCFAAFLVTFVTTRVVTRMIRADRGPFKDNVWSSGLHVHHAVPGIILLVVGAVTAVATDTDTRWSALAAVLVGVGTSLVLDEFALILRLEDVYWAEKGRISVEMVSLAVASMGLVLVGFTPFHLSREHSAALSVTLGAFALHLVWIVVCVSKGKYKLAFFGVFFTMVAFVGALRLARPKSRWARRRYGPDKLALATGRAARFDARVGPALEWVSDFVAGKPPAPDPAPATGPPSGRGRADAQRRGHEQHNSDNDHRRHAPAREATLDRVKPALRLNAACADSSSPLMIR